MTLHLQADAVIAFLLALVRGTTFFLTCPPFASSSIPFMAKTTIAAGLAVAAIEPLSHDPMPLSTPGLIGALVVQALAGALIGFVVQLFVSAITGAGTLIDVFSGLNLPPAIDPLGLDQVPLLGQLYAWLATVLIFTTGADGLLAQGFIRSFSVVGTTIPHQLIEESPGILASDLVSFFAASVEIAAPLVAVMFSAQILLGLLAKAAPQTNIYGLGFGLQLLLLLFVLGVAVLAVPADLQNLLDRGVNQLFGH